MGLVYFFKMPRGETQTPWLRTDVGEQLDSGRNLLEKGTLVIKTEIIVL